MLKLPQVPQVSVGSPTDPTLEWLSNHPMSVLRAYRLSDNFHSVTDEKDVNILKCRERIEQRDSPKIAYSECLVMGEKMVSYLHGSE